MPAKKLKILIIHTNYRFLGGEDTAVRLEEELLKNRYIVETLFFKNRNGFGGLLQFLTSIWNVKSAKRVKLKVLDFKPDIVHIHNWHFALGPLVFRCIKKLGIPVVHSLHNFRLICPSGILLHNQKLFLDSLYQNFPFTAIKKGVYRKSIIQTFWVAFIVWFHRKIGTWEKVDKYICLSENSVNIFIESSFNRLKDKFVIKPNFTNNNIARDKDVVRDSHFLFVGRLSIEKGIHDLVNSFKDLPYVLKIAGDGPLRAYVEQSQLKHPNIVYLGSLSPSNVTNEMQKATALISSSICLETFGITIVEAFSNHCAVITSDIGAPSTIVTNSKDGFHYKHGNVFDLRRVICEWISLSTTEKQLMYEEAYETYYYKYSSQKQYDYFETIYNDVLGL